MYIDTYVMLSGMITILCVAVQGFQMGNLATTASPTEKPNPNNQPETQLHSPTESPTQSPTRQPRESPAESPMDMSIRGNSSWISQPKLSTRARKSYWMCICRATRTRCSLRMTRTCFQNIVICLGIGRRMQMDMYVMLWMITIMCQSSQRLSNGGKPPIPPG